MAIDGVDQPTTPGWWLMRLSRRLADTRRQRRLERLWGWVCGDAPLPEAPDSARDAYRRFHHLGRSNFAELIVDALAERVVPIGVRTGADGSEADDAETWDRWTRANLGVVARDTHRRMFAVGEAYVIVGPPSQRTGVPLVTFEDPRHVVAEHDPATGDVLAALKVYHDDVASQDVAYLYLPGEVHVATRERTGDCVTGSIVVNASAWSWDASRSGPLSSDTAAQALLADVVPVIPFINRDHMGEFESHEDLLRRINHTILQRIVIATIQAFRQRAISGLPDRYPDNWPDESLAGKAINYDEILTADPGAFWKLPLDAKVWESGQVDLSGVLNSVKDDLAHLSAVTRTPLHVLTPDSANQSAEGAALSREGIVFKAEDRAARLSAPWSQVLSLMAAWLGDSDRVHMSPAQIQWLAPERYALTERASAAQMVASIGLPFRAMAQYILGFSPDQVDRMETDRANDQLLTAAVARAATTGQQPAPTPAQDAERQLAEQRAAES